MLSCQIYLIKGRLGGKTALENWLHPPTEGEGKEKEGLLQPGSAAHILPSLYVEWTADLPLQ